MKLAYTRKIINAIHDGSLLEAEYEKTPIFNLAVPTKVNGIPTEVLHPENSVCDLHISPAVLNLVQSRFSSLDKFPLLFCV